MNVCLDRGWGDKKGRERGEGGRGRGKFILEDRRVNCS